jgi:signal transduction histidine kinase
MPVSAPPRPVLDAALAVQMRYWARIAGVVVVLSNVVMAAWSGETFLLVLAIADIPWAIALVLASARPAWLTLAAAIAVVELSLVGWAGAGSFMLLVAAFAMRLRPIPAVAATLATWVAIAIGIAWFGDGHPPSHEMRAVDLAFAMANTFLLGALMRSAIASRTRAESLAEQLQAAHSMLQRDLVTTESLAAAQERTRIAQELHDNLGHSLAAAHVQVQLVRRLVGDGDAAVVDAVDLVGQSTRQAMHELRDAVALLRARSDGTTLGQRIRTLLARMPESVLAHHLRVVGEERPLAPAKEFALYRALQEAMTNVVKHARARTVLVVLEYDDAGTKLEIVDDGVGTTEIRHGFGLRGIAERMQSVGGRLEVASLPSAGFRLRVEVDAT